MRLKNISRVSLIALATLLTACGEKAPPAAAPSTPSTSPTPSATLASSAPLKLVRTLVVDTTAQEESNRYSGEVRARHETQLGFRTGGKIIERLVDAGARVKAGQALARLDPADAQLASAQAEANRALAAAELKRSQDLRAKNFISQAALDAKETSAKAAEAQAGLARNQTAYATLTADAPGVIAAVLAEPGQVVSAGQGIFRLARDGEREVAIHIPEGRLAGLKVGAGATVKLWAGEADDGGKRYRGVLRELAPAADPASRTFAARVRILDADASIALGMTASVSFRQREGGDRLVVPLAAIVQQGNTPTVWVVGKESTVTQRPIEIERYADAGVVVKAGLASGERIVAAGAHKLSAGEKVRIAEEPRK